MLFLQLIDISLGPVAVIALIFKLGTIAQLHEKHDVMQADLRDIAIGRNIKHFCHLANSKFFLLTRFEAYIHALRVIFPVTK